MATDAQGNVGCVSSNPDGTQAEVWSRDSHGAVRWRTPFGATLLTALAVAPSGELFVGGTMAAPEDGGTVGRAVVSKLDEAGRVVWTQTLGAAGPSWFPRYLAVARSGMIWALGIETELVGTGPNPSTVVRSVLARLGLDGQTLWQQTLGDPYGSIYPSGLALTAEGPAAVAFRVNQGVLQIGAARYDGTGTGRAVLAGFEPDGSAAWSQAVAEVREDNVEALVVGSDGALYAAGETIHENLGELTRVDVFVLGASARGEVRWRQRYSENSQTSDAVLNARPCGGLVLAARSGPQAILVLDLDASGNEARRRVISGSDYAIPVAIAPQGADGTVLLGGFRGELALDTMHISSIVAYDSFLARLSGDSSR